MDSILKHPDYLFIGHLCHDKTENGYSLGGTPAFGADWVQALGSQTGILTSFGKDFKFECDLNYSSIINTGSPKTTCFSNHYVNNNRTQFLEEKADDINFEKLPDSWRSAPLVHLAPLCDEISTECLNQFPDSTYIGVTPQGWLRKINRYGKVSLKRIPLNALNRADAIVLSKKECPKNQKEFAELVKNVKLLVVTEDEQGAIAYFKSEKLNLPSYALIPRFPTGAGDVFASVFFLKYFQSKDLKNAMIWAHCAASLHVENGCFPNEFKLNRLKQRIKDYISINKLY